MPEAERHVASQPHRCVLSSSYAKRQVKTQPQRGVRRVAFVIRGVFNLVSKCQASRHSFDQMRGMEENYEAWVATNQYSGRRAGFWGMREVTCNSEV